MNFPRSYKRISSFIQNESFEPLVAWGLRMAIAGTAPIVWGLATHRLDDAVWMAITAEGISWVEMKGSFNWRVRTLFIGAMLALFWGALGTITGYSIVLSLVCMFVAAFVSSLLKNLGDRASGLSICVYLMFIICNGFPDVDVADVSQRVKFIALGALWAIFVGLFASLIMPVQQPFRRQIAIIWRSISALVHTISRSAVDKKEREHIYVKEKEVRAAIDSSFEFYGRMVHQANKSDNKQYQLLLLRKNAALVATNVIAIADEMEHIRVSDLDETLRIKAATLFSALEEAVNRISVYVLTLKTEEKLLAGTQIKRIKKLTALIKEYPRHADEPQRIAIDRILQLTGRTTKLLESAIQRLENMGEDVPVFRSYSLMKTLFMLRPRKILSNLKTLTHFNTLTFRFALRSAIAATLALFIAKWFRIDHGYWLPFSLMIVIQPYHGATLKKARDRVVGTVLGGIAGALLSLIPTGLHAKELMLFVTFGLMVYYARRKYSVAAFVVTLNLVLVFNIDSSFTVSLLGIREACTIGGSLLAVISGFVLLPAWDKTWLPAHLADAVAANYHYFINTFYTNSAAWTRLKRAAESGNSDVFDSFNRYMEEPGKEKTDDYYDIITCNVRITRDINAIILEEEEKGPTYTKPTAQQQQSIDACLALFHQIIPLLKKLKPSISVQEIPPNQSRPGLFRLDNTQMISLEKMRIELKALLEDLNNGSIA